MRALIHVHYSNGFHWNLDGSLLSLVDFCSILHEQTINHCLFQYQVYLIPLNTYHSGTGITMHTTSNEHRIVACTAPCTAWYYDWKWLIDPGCVGRNSSQYYSVLQILLQLVLPCIIVSALFYLFVYLKLSVHICRTISNHRITACQPSGVIWRHTYSAAVTTLSDSAVLTLTRVVIVVALLLRPL